MSLFENRLTKMMGNKDFPAPDPRSRACLIPNMCRLIDAATVQLLLEVGFDPEKGTTVSDKQVIDRCVKILFGKMHGAVFEDVPEGGYMVRFQFSYDGEFFFRTHRNLPAPLRGREYFQKIDPSKVYRSIVQPDPTLLPKMIEFYIADILDDMGAYEKCNKGL